MNIASYKCQTLWDTQTDEKETLEAVNNSCWLQSPIEIDKNSFKVMKTNW